MTYYLGVVDRGGAGYGIWFPDLPGCTSGGKDEDDLFAMAIEAVSLWAEGESAAGRQPPVPRSVEALRADPEVIEALRDDGAVLVQVPMIIDEGRVVRANLSIDKRTLKTIDAAAARSKQTRSAFLVDAALEKIKRGG